MPRRPARGPPSRGLRPARTDMARGRSGHGRDPMIDRRLTFHVPGRPIPQGSVRAMIVKRGGRNIPTVMNTAGNPPLAAWRMKVTANARQALENQGWTPVEDGGAVGIKIVFLLDRPKHHFGTGRNATLVKDSSPEYPAGKPDIDKLVRAILDALTDAGVWADDSQVCYVLASKTWTNDINRREGATITLGRMAPL